MTFLSIIIPAYNEAERLPATLKNVQNFLAKQSYKAEVVVVNDGSKDATAAVVRKIAKTFPELHLIDNVANKGKGGVVNQGMLAAKGEFRLFMDSDGSTPIEEVGKLLAVREGNDVVIGSRHLDPDSIKIKPSLKRRIISRLSNMLIQSFALPGIRDTQCGFKLFSAEATEKVFPRQTDWGWLFDVELLVIAREQGLKIKEVAVDWSDADHSTLRASRAVRQSLRELLQINQGIRSGKYRA